MTTPVITAVERALALASTNRPALHGFPYYAETLRRAGVHSTEWVLPAMQSVYVADAGAVVHQQVAVTRGPAEVPPFDADALVAALRADQRGESTFAEFAAAAFAAGVLRWVVDLDSRLCTYFGYGGEFFEERYPTVSLSGDNQTRAR